MDTFEPLTRREKDAVYEAVHEKWSVWSKAHSDRANTERAFTENVSCRILSCLELMPLGPPVHAGGPTVQS
jgi:hypothetical protein